MPGPPAASRFCSLTRLRSRSARAMGGGRSSVVMTVGGRVPSRRRVCHCRSVSSMHEQRDGVEVEELPQLIHRRVEDLVEVERGGQRLGDLVQLVEQGVGVGEPTQAVEGQDLSLVGLARRCGGRSRRRGRRAGPRPTTARTCGASSSVKSGSQRPRQADGHDRDRGDAQPEAEPSCEPGHRDRGEHREGEGRSPVAGGHEGEEREPHLARARRAGCSGRPGTGAGGRCGRACRRAARPTRR